MPIEQKIQEDEQQPNNYSEHAIEFDGSLGKVIAQIICKEIEQSRHQNKEIYDRADRNERLYNQITKYQAKGKVPDSPWYGAADYFVPLTEWVTDAVWGRVLKVLFYKRPHMKAKGVEASDTEKEDGITDFVDQIHGELIDLPTIFKFYVKQMIKLPFAVMKYCWYREYDKVYEKDRQMTFRSPDGIGEEKLFADESDKAMQLVSNGWIPAGEQDVIVLKSRKIYDGTKLKYIKFQDYVWAGSAKKGMKPYWEGDRFWLTIAEMRQNDDFDKEAVEKLRKTINTSDMVPSEAALEQRKKLFECYNWYGKLPINKSRKVDFEDPDAIEQEVHAIISFKEQETLMLNHWEYKRIPEKERVYLRRGFEETERFDYRSLVDKLYNTQKELNTLHNSIMNNAMLCMMKVLWKRKTLVGEEWERPQIRPGMILEVDMPNDIGVLDLGDVKSISWELEQSFINFAERLSNISVYQTGTARSTGGQKTKGEVDRTVYEGNIGLDKFIEECYQALKTVSQWTVDYYYHNMPVGLERRIRGEDQQMIFPTEENIEMFEEKGIQPYWEADNLVGKYDFEWQNTSLNTSEAYQIQVSNDLQERYLPHPMIAQSLIATWEILKKGLIARKIRDWQKILPPREAVIQEMQRMEEEAQARQQAQKGEENIKGNAVQKAVEMGVPAAEAQKIVNQPLQQEGENVQDSGNQNS